MKLYDVIILNLYKSLKGVLMTFLVEFKFWVKNLKLRCYNDDVSKKGIEVKMGMTFWSIRIYG